LAISGSDIFAINPTRLGLRSFKLRNFHSEIQQNNRDFKAANDASSAVRLRRVFIFEAIGEIVKRIATAGLHSDPCSWRMTTLTQVIEVKKRICEFWTMIARKDYAMKTIYETKVARQSNCEETIVKRTICEKTVFGNKADQWLTALCLTCNRSFAR
jgi:hypothetical protein